MRRQHDQTYGCDHDTEVSRDHIGLRRTHPRETVAKLIAHADMRVLTDTGELIRELELDSTRDYQPQEHS
jgi:hypothetical protein